jgi:hypothetical protein
MTPSFHQGSAKIYQFPVRARPAAPRDQAPAAVEITAPGIIEVACGSGWYHEAAILESQRTGEH